MGRGVGFLGLRPTACPRQLGMEAEEAPEVKMFINTQDRKGKSQQPMNPQVKMLPPCYFHGVNESPVLV